MQIWCIIQVVTKAIFAIKNIYFRREHKKHRNSGMHRVLSQYFYFCTMHTYSNWSHTIIHNHIINIIFINQINWITIPYLNQDKFHNCPPNSFTVIWYINLYICSKIFPVWFPNRLINAWLEPFLIHSEKSCIESY